MPDSINVNIRYIARIANVSPATVSRVVNERPGIRRETRDRILEIIKWAGYTPNLLAKGLVTKGINIISLVIPRTSSFVFANPYYPEVLGGIAEVAERNQFRLLLTFGAGESYASAYRTGIANGIIIVSNRLYDPKVDELEREKIPTVLIPGLIRNSKLPSVNVDNEGGALKATEHLMSLGHEKIAFIGGSDDSKFYLERVKGFIKAFQKNGRSVNHELIIQTDFSQAGGFEAMDRLIRGKLRPTAVICFNDATAIGALLAVRRQNLSVPEDVSLLAFGNAQITGMLNPTLTTIEEPFHEMGVCAGSMLINLIRGNRDQNLNVILPVKLVLNTSTGRLRKKRVS